MHRTLSKSHSLLTPLYWLTGILLVSLALPAAVQARVYTTPEQALEQAFGKNYEKKRLHLYPAQKEAIEKKIGRDVKSRLYTVYVGFDANKRPTGYGFFHTERVRTKEQTLFIVVTPDEKIRDVVLISFYEPDDYAPTDRWLKLLLGKSKSDALTPGVDLPAISGATLTTRSSADTAKLSLALTPYVKQL